MTLQVTGKNVDAGGAFQSYITEKIESVLEKYIGPEISGHVRLEKERTTFRTDCSIRLNTGLVLEARGAGSDAYASADAAIERLEKRVRRYKRRLKDHHNGRTAQKQHIEVPARDYTVQAGEETSSPNDDLDNPIIIAENEVALSEITVSEAVMRLDLGDKSFLVFRNAGNGGINVVYRREDGNIGWIDPSAQIVAAA